MNWNLERLVVVVTGEYNRTLNVPYSILDKKYYVKAI